MPSFGLLTWQRVTAASQQSVRTSDTPPTALTQVRLERLQQGLMVAAILEDARYALLYTAHVSSIAPVSSSVTEQQPDEQSKCQLQHVPSIGAQDANAGMMQTVRHVLRL